MSLLALRLIAVYALTAALFLYLAHRFVRRIPLASALFLSCAPALFTGEALWTAGVQAPIDIAYDAPPLSAYRAQMGIGKTRSPILLDVAYSYIPWRKAVRHAVANGRWPLWNPFVHAGEPLLAVQEPAVFHPGTWIGFLLPLAQAWTFEMALHSFLALLAAYLFFRELALGNLLSCFGASAWAFSRFLLFYLGFPLSPAAAVFPLLLLGLRRLVRDPEGRGMGVTLAALLLIVTAGHPETLLHTVSGAGVYFLFELGWAGRGRRLRPLLRSLAAGALALGLSAVVLLPFAEVAPHSREHVHRTLWFAEVDKSVSLRESLRRSVQIVMPYAFGVSGRSDLAPGFGEPAAYAGSVLFPFAVAGALSKRRERWPFLLLAFLGLSLWARLALVTDAISALPFFEIALNQRLAFLAAFALCSLAVLGAERIGEGEGAQAFAAGGILTVAALILLFFLRRPRLLLELAMPAGELRGRFLMQVVPLVLLLLVFAMFPKKRAGRGMLVLSLALLLAQRRLGSGGRNPTFPSRFFFPRLEYLDKIPRGEPYRTAPLGYTYRPNLPTLYELEDVRGYASITLDSYARTFDFWCEADPIWWNRVENPAHPFLSFLNVRFFLGPPGYAPPTGWKVLARGEWGVLFENPNVLPRVFVPRNVFYRKTEWENFEIVKRNPNFAVYGVVYAPPERSGPSFEENGEAVVRIASYLPQEIRLEIEAKDEAVIATSIPGWPGWKLRLNGSEVPLIRYNWAFLAFRVPPGRHEAVLRYWPDGFVYGLSITAATLLVCLALLLTRASGMGQRGLRRSASPS